MSTQTGIERPGRLLSMPLVNWAHDVAAGKLAAVLPRRWRHVQNASVRAELIGLQLGEDAELFVASAWLHDIGYAPDLVVTGFHPLDGARYLRNLGCGERLCNLVAFHSSAATEARYLSLEDEMNEFTDERSLVRDLLWFVDMTTGPDGQSMTFEERMEEIRIRYCSDHYVVQALDAGMAERIAAVKRARQWVDSKGLTNYV